MKNISIKRLIAIIAGTLVLGVLLGWLLFGPTSSNEETTAKHDHTDVWTCSMHPQIRSNEPGKCPLCGMDLVPLSESGDDNTAVIEMTETAMRLAGVQTTIVGRDGGEKMIRLTGKVKADERRVYSQPSHIPGRIEQLALNFTGEFVRRGQTVARVYSPELVTAQEELRQAYSMRITQPALYEAARGKLKNWKLTEKQIDAMITEDASHTFPVLADVSGVVINKRVSLGDYVERGMALYDIADLSVVWVLFDLYERDLQWVKAGDVISFTVQSLPGESFEGKVSFVDPVINPATRAASARIEVNNNKNKLKPEMLVTGVVKSKLSGDGKSIVVPESAVLWTGERSVVYVKTPVENGAGFMMREVVIGPQVGDGYVVKEGLQPGEEIVTNGTFTVDAAAQLAGKPSMMNPAGEKVSTGHDHGNAGSTASVTSAVVSAEAEKALRQIFELYFELKDALVAGDLNVAKRYTGELQDQVNGTDMTLFDGAHHTAWMKHNQKLMDSLKPLLSYSDIEDVRSGFIQVSSEIISMASYFGSSNGVYYVQHCPMADRNNGADWLSREDVIRNPYFGDAMLTCGEVTAEIK